MLARSGGFLNFAFVAELLDEVVASTTSSSVVLSDVCNEGATMTTNAVSVSLASRPSGLNV